MNSGATIAKGVFSALLFMIFLFITTSLHAQVTIGFKAAINNAWRANIPGDNTDEYIHKSALQFSLLSYASITPHFSLGIEPGLVQRISQFDDFGEFSTIPTTFLMHYIEIPLLAQFRYPLWNSKMDISFKTGYGVSFLTSTTQQFNPVDTNGSPFFPPVIFHGNFNATNSLDHGFYGGVGIVYKWNKSMISLESEYYFGMRDAVFFQLSKNRSSHIGISYQYTL